MKPAGFRPASRSAGLKRFAVIMLLASACWPTAASAFWQRSQWLACSEAPTELERVRLNCYIFAPAYEWPLEYGGALSYRRSSGYGRSLETFQDGMLPPPPPPPRIRK